MAVRVFRRLKLFAGFLVFQDMLDDSSPSIATAAIAEILYYRAFSLDLDLPENEYWNLTETVETYVAKFLDSHLG